MLARDLQFSIFTRSAIQWRLYDVDLAVTHEANQIHGAGILRRSGIVGVDPPVAYRCGLIPVAERNVIGARGAQLLAMNEPRAHQSIRIAIDIDIVTVRRGKLPERRPGAWIGER